MNEKVREVLEDMELRQMNTDLSDQVVAMANDMVKGTSKLTLTEAKLLRLLIMQVKPTDKDFAMFSMKVEDFAKTLNVKKSNVYHEMDRITTHLMKEVIYIGDGNPKHAWQRFPWLTYASYDRGVLKIALNRFLKPYILGLQKWYTTYKIEDIIGFASIYSLRLYELLAMALKDQKPYGEMKARTYIDLDTIRRATNTTEKYIRISQFKQRVLDIAVRDINEKSRYHISYEDYKEQRFVVGFYFTVQSHARYEAIGKKEEQRKEEKHVQLTTDDI